MEITPETFTPNPDEAIILSYDPEELDYEQAREIFENVKLQYPGYRVIAIPAYTTLRSCSLEVIENIINELRIVADSLRGEDYLPF